MRLMSVVLAAGLLSACSGSMVPPASTPGAAPVARPAPSSPRPGVAPHPSTSVPVRAPTPATPIAPMPAATPPAGVTSAAAAGVVAGPAVAALPLTAERAAAALTAFRTSCPGLVRRTDSSGLTRGADWQPACDAARSGADADPVGFFGRWFEAVQVGDGRAFATGYYEPEIAGARTRGGAYQTPIYARPRDLVEVDLVLFSDDLKGKRVRGKVQGTAFVPYDDRTQIEEGSLDGRAPVLAYAADPVEFFFLQVQGSGRLRLPDGGVMRIGYDNQNGRAYTGIGALMRQRGLIGPTQASMQGLMGWLRANPEQGRAIMRENKSFVFFRELTGPGPLGAMGYPVVGGASIAVDTRFVPLGAPVLLSMDRADANGLWIAQDTGGAIKGANRVDTFWGAGDEARAIAGGMAARGTAFLLLPVGTLARLTAEGRGGGATPQP
ncbi:membrane-bound lytic murein transglycosylase A [Sphingomonas guangdongensis]|uniref:peptidoglycan lytic exotransglycosylase n=1 Tax=Sphingomonas guangdongensis TaxID=1141890 RepID=A0A285QCW2_9SPHN|nr:murein transglycosylase A [Sphingomonas guangdongensis]SOB79299.1 membrane-bound lytic murein transglycosylase A [Sphingomonas guangdongensis]